jgi:hypothetical protein
MRPTPDDDLVLLAGGLAVPLGPMLLLLELEARGLSLFRAGDVLHVYPGGQLTEAERQAIRRWRLHLLALVDDDGPPRVQ